MFANVSKWCVERMRVNTQRNRYHFAHIVKGRRQYRRSPTLHFLVIIKVNLLDWEITNLHTIWTHEYSKIWFACEVPFALNTACAKEY